jgi:hypothetical protein
MLGLHQSAISPILSEMNEFFIGRVPRPSFTYRKANLDNLEIVASKGRSHTNPLGGPMCSEVLQRFKALFASQALGW